MCGNRGLKMGEDLENYEITPEDLGCMGERENDPGVVEEAIGSGTVEKKEIRKSFAHIPFKQKKRAKKLYDNCYPKDMSFEDFCIELYALESPALMQADLQKIVLEKQDRSRRAFANQQNIERNLN